MESFSQTFPQLNISGDNLVSRCLEQGDSIAVVFIRPANINGQWQLGLASLAEKIAKKYLGRIKFYWANSAEVAVTERNLLSSSVMAICVFSGGILIDQFTCVESEPGIDCLLGRLLDKRDISDLADQRKKVIAA